MKSSIPLQAPLRASLPAIMLVATVSAALMGIVLLLRFWKGVPIHHLTPDVTSIVGAPAYTGFISQVGMLFWAGAAAVCLFSAAAVSRHAGGLPLRRFYRVSGALTLVLALDDLFMLHEGFFPGVGVPEKAVLASYAAFVLFYLVRFGRVILGTEYLLLGTAFAFFGASVVLDLLNPAGINPYLLEDGTKLVGIVAWLAYFFRAGIATLAQAGPQPLVLAGDQAVAAAVPDRARPTTIHPIR